MPDEGEPFKWFLACLPFGKPIQQEIAERAYARLASAGLRNPDKVLDAGWDELVRLRDEAHYVRYDFSTATKHARHVPGIEGALRQHEKTDHGGPSVAHRPRPGAEVQTHRPGHRPDLHSGGSANLARPAKGVSKATLTLVSNLI